MQWNNVKCMSNGTEIRLNAIADKRNKFTTVS